MTIEVTSVVGRREGILSAPVDDEIVILNPDRDDYLGLDPIGRAVWDLLETPHGVVDLCRRLSEDFDATPEEIVTDVLVFLTEMAEEGVVQIMEPGFLERA